MDKALIVYWLEHKKAKTYTIIVDTYFNELHKLGVSRFREWVAKELGVSVNLINFSSLNSAYYRFKKQNSKPKSSPYTALKSDGLKWE